MNTAQRSIACFEATLFDGVAPVGRAASVALTDDALLLELAGEGTTASQGVNAERRHYAARSVRVSRPPVSEHYVIELPTGEELLCPNEIALSTLPRRRGESVTRDWLDRRNWVATFAGLALLSFVGIVADVGIPRVADALAARVMPLRSECCGSDVRSGDAAR